MKSSWKLAGPEWAPDVGTQAELSPDSSVGSGRESGLCAGPQPARGLRSRVPKCRRSTSSPPFPAALAAPPPSQLLHSSPHRPALSALSSLAPPRLDPCVGPSETLRIVSPTLPGEGEGRETDWAESPPHHQQPR
jgi:hypothetical protein